ncbi:MAG: hypothetical protein SO373_02345 [Candidatus Borkfalkiaceae bacterium]|nr:hypothetical protein [Christensenellaceae bacterium]
MNKKSPVLSVLLLIVCCVVSMCMFFASCEKAPTKDSSVSAGDSSHIPDDSSIKPDDSSGAPDDSSVKPDDSSSSVKPDPDPQPSEFDLYPIADAYEKADGATVTVCGVVVGFVGNSFYISDGKNGMYVYCGKTPRNVSVGDVTVVTAKKTTFSGLVELQNIEKCKVVDSNFDMPAVKIDALSEIDGCLSMNIDVENVALSGTLGTPAANKDYSVKITDGKTTVTLFVSKYLPESFVNDLYEVLCDTPEAFSVKNAVVSYHDGYQIAFTESTEVVGKTYAVTDIELKNDEVTVSKGTALVDVADYLTVYAVLENNSKKTLGGNEFTLGSSDYNGDAEGSYTVTVKYGEFSINAVVNVKVLPNYRRLGYGDVTPIETAVSETGITRGLPSIGSPKVLVIPVAFTDYKADASMKSTLEKAFFGTSEDTGWESLNSYYKKSSYGKLDIGGMVTDVYNTGKSSSYYENQYTGENSPEYEIIEGALEHFDSQINYSDYDTDNDGYIDGIYLVYTAPVDQSVDSYWWAFTYEYYTETPVSYDNKEADFYMFLGYEFFSETTANGASLTINCETIIHETGHLLGIDDYYDYDDSKGVDGGIGGGDMMDANVGDHNAFTKLLLGWVDPYVVTGNCSLTLSSFGASGDCVMICKNKADPFSEYYIIDYYTPDGLNAMEKGYSGLFSVAGVRVYHVAATMKSDSSQIYGIWEIYENNNSDTTNKLLSLVEADGGNDIANNEYSANSDLFAVGKTISGLKWYDGAAVKATVKIANAASGDGRTLTFAF